jgi:hypothetical protein
MRSFGAVLLASLGAAVPVAVPQAASLHHGQLAAHQRSAGSPATTAGAASSGRTKRASSSTSTVPTYTSRVALSVSLENENLSGAMGGFDEQATVQVDVDGAMGSNPPVGKVSVSEVCDAAGDPGPFSTGASVALDSSWQASFSFSYDNALVAKGHCGYWVKLAYSGGSETVSGQHDVVPADSFVAPLDAASPGAQPPIGQFVAASQPWQG